MKFIKTVSLPFDPILPKQPSARLHQGKKRKYYIQFDFAGESMPFLIKGEDPIEAELNTRTMLYIMRGVFRRDQGYPPDFPSEFDRRLTEEMPAFINWLDEYVPRPFQAN